jgi:hypothetical protein
VGIEGIIGFFQTILAAIRGLVDVREHPAPPTADSRVKSIASPEAANR